MLSDLLKKTVERMLRKKGLVEEILQLTMGQAELLGAEEAHGLLVLIEQKQKCIDNIAIVNKELWQMEIEILKMSGLSCWLEGEKVFNQDWQKIGNLRRDIEELLRETQRLDGRNRQVIAKKFGELKISIKALQATKGSLKAYKGIAAQPGGYFIDHKK